MALGLLLFCMHGQADALTLTTTTNFATWQSATGSTLLEDFSGEANGSFTSRDFGDFTGTLFNPAGTTPSVISNEIRLQSTNSNSFTRFSFDAPLTAFGLNWRNTDTTGDKIEMNISGNNYIFGSAGSSGFFGVVATGGIFSNIDIGDSAGNGGALSYGYIDNFRYEPIPEPTTMLLFGSGLIGLAGFRRRFKKS